MSPVAKRNGRTRRERRNADALKAQRLQPCRRCGQPIDYTAPPGTPNAFMAGHIKAWKLHPELRDDPTNLQPEHDRCGKSAHTLDGNARGDLIASEDW